ncbi:MAG: hypothetical protein GXO74_08695 [Calditrichaeota bacterium]|nr:hypothetical protein [Calditrichota bacterium]
MSLLSKTIKKLHDYTDGNSTKIAINQLIREYGKMLNFTLDNDAKKITGDVLLKGETAPISFSAHYEIVQQGQNSFIRLISARTDREWINAVLKNFVLGQNFPMPADKFGLIQDLLA